MSLSKNIKKRRQEVQMTLEEVAKEDHEWMCKI